MIVEVAVPANIVEVRYGKCTFIPDKGVLELPAYVAKTVAALAGCSCQDDLSQSVEELLTASEHDHEANYALLAYGQSLPDLNPHDEDGNPMTPPDVRAIALTLLATCGAPLASLA